MTSRQKKIAQMRLEKYFQLITKRLHCTFYRWLFTPFVEVFLQREERENETKRRSKTLISRRCKCAKNLDRVSFRLVVVHNVCIYSYENEIVRGSVAVRERETARNCVVARSRFKSSTENIYAMKTSECLMRGDGELLDRNCR